MRLAEMKAMNSFEFNKIMGAVFGTLLFVLALNILTDGLFSPKKPAIAGYALPEPEVAGAAPQTLAAPQAPAEPLPIILAKADPARGENAAKKCAACHSFNNGGANKVGPNLWNVVAGTKAHIDGFAYSAALKERKAKGEKWDFANLYEFIKNPKGYLPGTSMSFAGIASAQERADILSYLRTLSDNPAPLPQ
jgi:cytochrome c